MTARIQKSYIAMDKRQYTRGQRFRWMASLLFLALLVGGLGWTIYAPIRQERLNHVLIAAIKKNDTQKALPFGLTSLTSAHTTAQRGQPDPLDHQFELTELALHLPTRSATAKRMAQERYAFLKWIMSRNPGFYLLETEQHYGALLFPIGRSDRAYTLELPCFDERRGKYGTYYYRVSCYQRKEGRYQLVYRVNLEDERDRIVTKRSPARKVARIETLLEDLRGYPVKGAISKFARSDLSAKRDYVEYGVSLGENGLYVTLFPANQGHIYDSNADVYVLDYDPYRKVSLKDEQFYQEYGLPVAKEELRLLP